MAITIFQYNSIAFLILDVLILTALLLFEFSLYLTNILGYAWWARVQTSKPDVTYWFGPFIHTKKLKSELDVFLRDLSFESPSSINVDLVRSPIQGSLTLSKES